MQKFINLLIVFSLTTHASVCNLYSIKQRIFDHAEMTRKVIIPYHLKVLNHKISGTPFHEIITDYVSSGISKKYFSEEMVEGIFARMKRSGLVEQQVLEEGILDGIYSQIQSKNSGFDIFKKELSEKVESLSYGPSIKNAFDENINDFEKLSHIDALTISKFLSELTFEKKKDVDSFFQLVLTLDTFPKSQRREILSNFPELFLAVKTWRSEKLNKNLKRAYKRYREMEYQGIEFRKLREAHHGNKARAIKEANKYRKIKSMCRVKTMNNLPGSYKNSFKYFSYAGTILATYSGFKLSGAWDKEEGKKKFAMELSMNLVSMWIGAKATASDGLSNSVKMLIWYMKGFLYNVADKELYEELFDSSTGNPLIFDELKLTEVINELSKNSEVAEVFRRIDEADDPSAEAENLLREYHVVSSETEVSTEILETIIQGMSERLVYEQEHKDNIIKTGSEAKDRFTYNNYFLIGGNLKAFLVFTLIYRTFCGGIRVGPFVAGGVTRPIQAFAIATGIMFLDRWGTSALYYKLREKYIKQ